MKHVRQTLRFRLITYRLLIQAFNEKILRCCRKLKFLLSQSSWWSWFHECKRRWLSAVKCLCLSLFWIGFIWFCCQGNQKHYISQLQAANSQLSRVRVKVIGNSGTGKTKLIESLKYSLFGGFLQNAFPQKVIPDVDRNSGRRHIANGICRFNCFAYLLN